MTNKTKIQVYKASTGEGFEWLLPVNGEFESLNFDGRSRKDTWTPVNMKRLTVVGDGPQKGKCRTPSDFPCGSGSHMMMVSGRAKKKIGAYLEQYGELLPLVCEDVEFWTYNVTTILDALDEEKCNVLRARDADRLLMIHKHVFRASALEHAEVFKLPQRQDNLIYITDRFVTKIRAAGLVGLAPTKLWEG